MVDPMTDKIMLWLGVKYEMVLRMLLMSVMLV